MLKRLPESMFCTIFRVFFFLFPVTFFTTIMRKMLILIKSYEKWAVNNFWGRFFKTLRNSFSKKRCITHVKFRGKKRFVKSVPATAVRSRGCTLSRTRPAAAPTPGTDSMKLHFGRKFFRQIFTRKIFGKISSENDILNLFLYYGTLIFDLKVLKGEKIIHLN
jgi:hypothetical protein